MKETKKALMESPIMGYAHHQIVLDDTGNPVDYRFLEANETFSKITGIQHDKIIGHTVKELLPDIVKDSFDWVSYYGNIALNCLEDSLEQYSLALDRWYKIHVYSVSKYYFTTIFIDITDNTTRESAIAERETNFRTFFDSLPDMVFVSSMEGRIIHANASAYAELGYSADELEGLEIKDIHLTINRAELDKLFAEIFAGNANHSLFPLRRKDRKVIPVECKISPGKWNNNDCLFWVAKDVSAEQEALRNLDILFYLNPSLVTLSELPQRRYIKVNDAFVDLVGKPREEIIGKTIYEMNFIEPVKQLHLSDYLLEKTGEFHNLQFGIRDASGNIHPALVSAVPINVGNQKYLLTVSTDISEQKQLETELASEKAKLADIIEGTNAGTWEWNVQTGETVFNEKWASMIGYSLEEVLPTTIKTWENLTHPDDVRKTNELLNRHFRKESDYFECQFRMRHKAGYWVWVLDRGKVASWTEDGKPLLMFGTHLDITKQKNDEETIRLLTSLQHLLIKISADFINISSNKFANYISESLGKIGRLLDLDRIHIINYDFNNSICTNIYEWYGDGIIVPEYNTRSYSCSLIPEWVELHRKGKALTVTDANALKKGSNIRNVLESQGIKSLLALPLMDGKKCLGFIGFDTVNQRRDFSEQEKTVLIIFGTMYVNLLKRLEAQKDLVEARRKAEKANRAKSEFLANMSHEIRTPLNGVIGFTELLGKTPLEDVQQQYVESAYTSGLSLLHIINDILDFSKIEAGMLNLEIISCDILELLGSSVDIIAYNASRKGIEVLLDISPGFPRYVHIDPVRFKQVLANLLGNAVKFTEKGEIELKASFSRINSSEGKFAITVRDTGIGIDSEQKKRLFVAFSQADSSTTRRFGGTGLGLVISNMIAKKMGSKIEVESRIGKGSVFCFEFTAQYEEDKTQNVNSLSSLKNCLLVDDNEKSSRTIKQMLENWGIKTVSANSGLKAVEYIQSARNFDLIIIDYNMPSVNGIETLRQIRQTEKLSGKDHPVIIMYSPYDYDELIAQRHEHYINNLLSKPIKIDELYNCLTDLGRKSREIETLDQAAEIDSESVPGLRIKPGAKILLAEDIGINMKLVKNMLEKLYPDLPILVAVNGQEALDIYKAEKPGIILMDVQMPVMDGLEATKKIREEEKASGFRSTIIALSAGVLKEERDRCKEAGMDNFLAKPFNMDKLDSLLAHLVWDTKVDNKESLINFNIGLSHSANDSDFYLSLLKEFNHELKTRFSNIIPCLLEGENIEAQKLLHSLKGVAGILGMESLGKSSEFIEEKLYTGAELEKSLVDDFANEIKKMERYIDSLESV